MLPGAIQPTGLMFDTPALYNNADSLYSILYVFQFVIEWVCWIACGHVQKA